MLFCLLHPMDHNTGPLARKSSTLCSLLLLSIAALLVLAVPGQANSEEVGIANHKLDGDEVELNEYSKENTPDNLTSDVYKERFSDVCDFKITKDYIELRYNGSGCTVELITERGKKMIKFTTGVRSEGTGCLDDCDGKVAHFKHGFSNLLPFAYSRTKKELEKLNEGPDSEATGCGDEGLCGCMSQTFLEVSWSTCSGYIYAHTHLIGEVKQGLSHERRFGSGDEEFNFNLTTKKSEFTMDFDKAGETNFNSMNKPISCVPNKANAIVGPKTWKIKNIMKGKYLLVFHLLSKSATREFKDNKVDKEQQPKEEAPKCDLFVRFTRPEYEFLYVGPITTTTVTTTTATNTTPSSGLGGQGSTPKTGTHQGNTPKVQGKGSEKESDNTMMIVIIVIVVVVVVLVIGVVLIFILKNKGSKEDELQKVKQTTTKANKSSAVTL